MTTPTSPDRPPERRLSEAVEAIAAGAANRSALTAFSDVTRSQAAYLESRWNDIPVPARVRLIRLLADLAEESVSHNFNRVFRIALDDESPLVRQIAIASLWEDTGSDLPGTYLRMVGEDESDDVRAEAAAALGEVCDRVAAGDSQLLDRDQIIERLVATATSENESPIVRRRCMESVASFGDDSRVVDLIRTALEHDDQTIVAGAVHAMGRTANATWLPIVVANMQSEDAELRFEAARAAGMIGEPDSVPELADLAYDSDSEVRASAITALGRIGGPPAIRVLRALSEDEEQDLEAIEDAMGEAQLTVDPLERVS